MTGVIPAVLLGAGGRRGARLCRSMAGMLGCRFSRMSLMPVPLMPPSTGGRLYGAVVVSGMIRLRLGRTALGGRSTVFVLMSVPVLVAATAGRFFLLLRLARSLRAVARSGLLTATSG